MLGVGVAVLHRVGHPELQGVEGAELPGGMRADGQLQALQQQVDLPGLGRKAVDQPVGQGRRRLDVRMGHHVHHVVVMVVPDGREHRQRELRHIDRQVVVVEADQVHGTAAATQQQHHVEISCARRDVVERRDDARRSRVALHQGGEQPHLEAEAILVFRQMPLEVAPARRRLAGNHGQPPRQRRKRKLAVHLEHPLLLQPGDGALAGQLEFAHGERGVDVVDH